MSSFVILDAVGMDIVWAGQYYSTGCTNNKAELCHPGCLAVFN